MGRRSWRTTRHSLLGLQGTRVEDKCVKPGEATSPGCGRREGRKGGEAAGKHVAGTQGEEMPSRHLLESRRRGVHWAEVPRREGTDMH